MPKRGEPLATAVKEAQEAIDVFATGFETAYAAGLSRKLACSNRGRTICP